MICDCFTIVEMIFVGKEELILIVGVEKEVGMRRRMNREEMIAPLAA